MTTLSITTHSIIALNTVMLSVVYDEGGNKPIMPSVVMLNVALMNDIVPI